MAVERLLNELKFPGVQDGPDNVFPAMLCVGVVGKTLKHELKFLRLRFPAEGGEIQFSHTGLRIRRGFFGKPGGSPLPILQASLNIGGVQEVQ